MDFKDEFYRITNLIDNNNSFVFTRYGDGEVMLINGDEIGKGTQAHTIDKWSSKGETKLGNKLNDTLYHNEDTWIYGIPCQCCNNKCKGMLLNKLNTNQHNITYANLWVNANYQLFKKWLCTLDDNIVIIGNYKGENMDYPFKVKKYVTVPDDCVNFYEKYQEVFDERIISETKEFEQTLFLISAGPLSEVIIEHLWRYNPNNKYIDVGSALDEFIHNKKTRPYMIDGNYYNIKKCKF